MKKLFVLLFLVSLSFGCAAKSNMEVVTEVILPPKNLFTDCARSDMGEIKTNADLLKAYQSAQLDFNLCNSKIKALQNWYKHMETKVNTKRE